MKDSKFTKKNKTELIGILQEKLNKYQNTSMRNYYDALQEYTDEFSKYVEEHSIKLDDWWKFESYCLNNIFRKIEWSDNVLFA